MQEKRWDFSDKDDKPFETEYVQGGLIIEY